MVRFYRLSSVVIAAALVWTTSARAAKSWTVIHEQDPSATEIHLQWVVRSGSLSDGLDKPGLAHFTARALLRGTSTRPYADLQRAFQAISATVTVETQQESTRFVFHVPANRFDPFLHLVRDVFSNPEFDPLEMERLRADLLAETRSALQDPRRLVSRVAMREFYSGTTAQASSEGEEASLARISATDIRRFYREHYGVSNFLLAITSPHDESVVRSKISQILSSIPDVSSQPVVLPAPTARGISGIIISDSATVDVPFQVLLPGVPATDSERIGLELANRAFGVGPDSRLAQFAPNLNGWLTWASSGFNQVVPSSQGAGPYSITGVATLAYAFDVVPATVDLFRWFVDDGVTEQEFQKARDETLAAVPGSQDAPRKRLDQKLESALSGRSWMDLPGWQAELGRWSAKTVSISMKSRMAMNPVVIVVLGNPAQLVPVLQAVPGMGPVRVIQR
jgi:zinc protease